MSPRRVPGGSKSGRRGPKTAPRAPRSAPRGAQERPGGAEGSQGATQEPPGAAKSGPRAAHDPSGGLPEASGERFSSLPRLKNIVLELPNHCKIRGFGASEPPTPRFGCILEPGWGGPPLGAPKTPPPRGGDQRQARIEKARQGEMHGQDKLIISTATVRKG